MRHVSLTLAFVALAALALATAACGGDEKPATEAAPTPTDVARTPIAGQPAALVGRADCPPDWLAYRTDAFSLCYPQDHYAATLSTAAFPNIVAINLISGAPLIDTLHALSVWASDVIDPTVAACPFDSPEAAGPDGPKVEEVDLGHVSAETCTVTLADETQYLGAAAIEGGSIAFRSRAGTGEQLALSKQILGTLVPEP